MRGGTGFHSLWYCAASCVTQCNIVSFHSCYRHACHCSTSLYSGAHHVVTRTHPRHCYNTCIVFLQQFLHRIIATIPARHYRNIWRVAGSLLRVLGLVRGSAGSGSVVRADGCVQRGCAAPVFTYSVPNRCLSSVTLLKPQTEPLNLNLKP